MTTYFMIADRLTGEPYRSKPKLYTKEGTAKGVLTAEGPSYAPGFRWAVVEVELNIVGMVPGQGLDKAEFNTLVNNEVIKLDKIVKEGRYDADEFNFHWKRNIDEVSRFTGAYKKLKYV